MYLKILGNESYLKFNIYINPILGIILNFNYNEKL